VNIPKVLTLAIKKRIDIEQFIERQPFKENIRYTTHKGQQRIGLLWMEGYIYFALNCHTGFHDVGMKDRQSTCLEMSLRESSKNRTKTSKYHEMRNEKIT